MFLNIYQITTTLGPLAAVFIGRPKLLDQRRLARITRPLVGKVTPGTALEFMALYGVIPRIR